MKKHLLVILAIITVVMSFKTNNGGLKVDTIAPEFSMKDINGAVVKLSDYRGKVVLISFWASWCKQCRAESPKLVKSYQRFQNAKFQDGNGFEIISISLDDNIDDWKAAVAQEGFTWANIGEGKKWDADIAKLYQVSSLPTNYLLDRNGKIIEKDLRGNMLENVLSAIKK
ncbi:MAG: TlpA disulfide reductase family protein [Bacteroidetes bacterium]|nr:TlpA disulfide reductase family protein [Bacteroidota bacterium]